MRFVNRAALGWGPCPASSATLTQGLVIHYDGSDQGLAGRAHSMCLAYWRRTRSFHTGPARGWADIGYSFGCCPHGFVFEGRGLDRVQAAQPGGNSSWYSCTLMSGPGEDPTPEQVDAVRQLRAWLMSKGVGPAVKGHRDFYSTSCPGDRLYRLVRDGVFSGSPSKEDDVSAKDVWAEEIPVPYGSKENPEWQAKSLLVNHGVWLRKLDAKLDAQNAAIGELVKALAQRDEAVDVEGLVARIEAAIERVQVRLDVGSPTP
ncbi:peptidoglycan recognition protein family protein [Streptosporangium sp. NPDC004631]